MKITLLGTSHGVSEPHRRTACSLLEVGDRHYIIDMGFSALDELLSRGIPMESVRGVFITHTHADHVNGLIDFCNQTSWYYRTCRPVFFLPKLELVENIRRWLEGVYIRLDDELVFREIAEGVIYDDGVIRVTAVPTEHFKPSYAFYIEAEGKAVLFTGDLRNPKIDFPELAKERHPELIVLEGAHFSGTDALAPLRAAAPKQVFINHYAPWHIPSILELAEAVKDEFPVVLSEDGMEITL